jgi:uncharacterized membrane protein
MLGLARTFVTMAIKRIIISSIILVILDATYIYLNKSLFENKVVDIQRVVMQVKPAGAIVTYLILIFALNYFIIRRYRGPEEAFLLGLVIYGVFEGTNYAIFKKWPASLALMDTVWGGTLFAATTYLTHALTTPV